MDGLITMSGKRRSRSLRGTQVAALLYTLCETAELVGVECPRAYPLRALYAAIARPGPVTDPEDLLISDPPT